MLLRIKLPIRTVHGSDVGTRTRQIRLVLGEQLYRLDNTIETVVGMSMSPVDLWETRSCYSETAIARQRSYIDSIDVAAATRTALEKR